MKLKKIDIFTNDFNVVFFEDNWGINKKVCLYSETGIIISDIAWGDWEDIKYAVQEFDISSEKNVSRRILVCDAEDKSKILGLIIIRR